MEENAEVRDPEEQAVITRQRWELSSGRRREDWPDPLPEGYEPARGQFEPPLGKVSGHRCDGWRRMTGDEGYFVEERGKPIFFIADRCSDAILVDYFSKPHP